MTTSEGVEASRTGATHFVHDDKEQDEDEIVIEPVGASTPTAEGALEEGAQAPNTTLDKEVSTNTSLPPDHDKGVNAPTRSPLRTMRYWLIPLVLVILAAIVVAIIIPVTQSNNNSNESSRGNLDNVGGGGGGNNGTTPTSSVTPTRAPSLPNNGVPSTVAPTVGPTFENGNKCPVRPPPVDNDGGGTTFSTDGTVYVRHEITWGGRTAAGNCDAAAPVIRVSCRNNVDTNSTSALMIVSQSTTQGSNSMNHTVTCDGQEDGSFLCQGDTDILTDEDEGEDDTQLNHVSLVCYGTNALNLDAIVEILSDTNDCTTFALSSRNEYWSLVTVQSSCGDGGEDDLPIDDGNNNNGTATNEEAEEETGFTCSANAELIGFEENSSRDFCATQEVCRVFFRPPCTLDFGGISLQTNVNPLLCPRPFSTSRLEGEFCFTNIMCESRICVDSVCRSGPGCDGMDCEMNEHCQPGTECSTNGLCTLLP